MPRKSKKITEPHEPKERTAPKATLPEDYTVRMQLAKLRECEENAERLYLQNIKQRLDNTKCSGNLCYMQVALDEMNEALTHIAEIIKEGAERLSQDMQATAEQSDVLDRFFNDLLSQLSEVEIKLSTTTEVDAQLDHAGRAARMLKRGS